MSTATSARPVSLNVKVDPVLKSEADSLARDLGMNLTTAVTVYLKKFVSERRIPFEISADPFYHPANIAHLEHVVADLDSGRVQPVRHDLIEE